METLFREGDLVHLRSDHSLEGAVIGILDGGRETRYRVFIGTAGIQIFYESQLERTQTVGGLTEVDENRFHAELTASLIRNPSLSSLYSLNAARIDFIPHQFRPVLKFIKSDQPRLLIADSVGVGKTIEAGLILRELQARHNISSVLIICPRPLITEQKWEDEMRRFGESFTAIDGDTLRYCIKETDYDGEWPEKLKKAVIPYSLFDRVNIEGVATGRKAHLGLMQLDPPPKFDLVIVDEAHHIRNTETYAYKAVKYFTENANAVIFLTATPVQLEYDDLFVLLNLLRPDLIIDKETFHEMAVPNASINKATTIIRRFDNNWQIDAYEALKSAIYDTQWGRTVISKNPIARKCLSKLKENSITPEERVKLITEIEGLHTFSGIISRTRRRDIGEFTIRKATTVEVEFTVEQKKLHNAILNFMHEVYSTIHCTDNTKFMMTTIRRQTASCLFGLVPLLKDILYRHMDELIDDTYVSKVEFNQEIGKEFEQEVEQIIKMANKLPPKDPKLERLIRIIIDKQDDIKNKVMIFSSFRHTLSYLKNQLTAKGFRAGLVHGDVNQEERRLLRERFKLNSTEKDAIDILLFSEVGCEGLDYQFCDCMINYDLPWNPMRIEQRIGRIDRNGQTSESVSIFNMVTPGTVDYDIYNRCTARIGVFRQSIGDCEEILGSMSKDIQNIADNFYLTESERQDKLQQLADNKIRLVQERLDLEEKQRDLFGIRVPQSSFNEELKQATNYWLSPEKLENVVKIYLKQRLGDDKEFILGEKKLKTLRLSQNARSELLEDFRSNKLPRNQENRRWEKWLLSGEQHLQVTFDRECSKKNPEAVFITLTHPLSRQASTFLESENKVVSVLHSEQKDIPPGEYPFIVYQWKMFGEREDLQLKPISASKILNAKLLELLKEKKKPDTAINARTDLGYWEEVEQIHHDLWRQELERHKANTQELIAYREGSLTTSHNARVSLLQDQIAKASHPNIRQMREGELRKENIDYLQHMRELTLEAEKADIVSEPIAYGIMKVDEKKE